VNLIKLKKKALSFTHVSLVEVVVQFGSVGSREAIDIDIDEPLLVARIPRDGF
jgi:hypothetical protein